MSQSRMMFDLTPPDAGEGDRRLDAPAFHRNGLALVDALTPRLAETEGEALEIGSGTGQHVALYARAFPRLTWRPSDPNPAHRASIDAWRAHLGLETIRPAIDLDVAASGWSVKAAPPEGGFRAVLCANVIHIAPWIVAEGLFHGAAALLAPGGFLALYGPFRWHGRHISESNALFDDSLRMRDPSWGVREIDAVDGLAAASGLERTDTVAMPANNHFLVYAPLIG